jgi:Flp pilus assembly protein TadD
LAEVVRNFLDASLQQRPEARAFLSRSVEQSASDTRLNLQFKAAAPVPPTQRQMAEYLRQHGVDASIAMLRAFPDVAQSKLVGGIMTLLGDDDVKTALASLRLAEKTYPQNAGIQVMLGNVLARTGDNSGAEQAYRRALVLLPDDNTVGGFRSYWNPQIEQGLKALGLR